ncbi:MAG: hypothetical protein HKN68_00060 [Saprospiraceae bacterium]|nr:hypothetical protein [Saprospiraceae bacterium]
MNTNPKMNFVSINYFKNYKAYYPLLILLIVAAGCSSPKALPLIQDDEVKVTSKTAELSNEKMYYDAISDKINIPPADGNIHIPFQDLDKLKVKRGQRSLLREGFIGGLLAGIIVGNIVAPKDGRNLEGFNQSFSYFLIGTGIGTVFGLVSTVDRWKNVPLDKFKLSLMPNSGGAVGVGITFRLN